MKKFKRWISWLLCVLLIAGSMPINIMAENDGKTYVGYLDKTGEYNEGEFKFPLYVIPLEDAKKLVTKNRYEECEPTSEDIIKLNEKAEVVYCMDSKKQQPPSMVNARDDSWWLYEKMPNEKDSLIEGSTSKNIGGFETTTHTDEEIIKGLAWVMKNGYPNNEFQGNMTVSEYRALTQWAVYYYTMGRTGTNLLSNKEQKDTAAQFKLEAIPQDFDSEEILNSMSVYKSTNKSQSQYLIGFSKITKPEVGSLKITKTIKGDVTEDELNGALTFKITDPDGKETTYNLRQFNKEGENEYVLLLKNIKPGKYKVEETTKDIDGKEVTVKYSVNEEKAVEGDRTEAEVDADKETTVAFENSYEDAVTPDGNVVIKKVDQFGKYVVGAELRITKKATTIASASNATASASNASGAKSFTILNGNSISIGISKTSRKIDLNIQNSGSVAEWTTENKAYALDLTEGTYVLEEVNVPAGYKKAEPIEFTIDTNGNITENGEVKEELVMIDEKTTSDDGNDSNDDDDDNTTSNNGNSSDNGGSSNNDNNSSSSSSSSGGGSSSSGGSSGGGSGSSSSGGPGVVTKIIDNQVTPQTGLDGIPQDTTDVATANRSLGGLPKTADGTNDLIWMLLGLLSMSGLAIVYVFDKKKFNK